jgi:hypothetical protein
MRIYSQLSLLLLAGVPSITANTEKAIFTGPESLPIPQQHPSLRDLKLEVLSPANRSFRTHVLAPFPTEKAKSGLATWLLLDNLTTAQRYEVRVCWAATVRYPKCQHLT